MTLAEAMDKLYGFQEEIQDPGCMIDQEMEIYADEEAVGEAVEAIARFAGTFYDTLYGGPSFRYVNDAIMRLRILLDATDDPKTDGGFWDTDEREHLNAALDHLEALRKRRGKR